MTRSLVLCCALLAVFAQLSEARARSSRTLSWKVPPGCPSLAEAERRLIALTGDPRALRRGAASVLIDVASTGELRAQVWLLRTEGTEHRIVYGTDCAALTDAALLIVGLGLEGEALLEVPTAPAAADPLPRRIAPPAGMPTRPGYALALGPQLELDGGSLPQAAVGVGAALRLRGQRWLAELSGAWWLPRVERLDSGAGAELSIVSATVRAGYIVRGSSDLTRTRLTVSPSAALELGQVRGSGLGLGRARERSGTWSALLLGASFALGPSHRLHPLLRAEVGFPLRRPVFELESGAVLFQANSVIARLGLRIDLELL